ncbi:hypothetical protein [Coleofasciculus sp.]
MDKEHLSAEARAIRDRLFGWDSPTQAQLSGFSPTSLNLQL